MYSGYDSIVLATINMFPSAFTIAFNGSDHSDIVQTTGFDLFEFLEKDGGNYGHSVVKTKTFQQLFCDMGGIARSGSDFKIPRRKP